MSWSKRHRHLRHEEETVETPISASETGTSIATTSTRTTESSTTESSTTETNTTATNTTPLTTSTPANSDQTLAITLSTITLAPRDLPTLTYTTSLTSSPTPTSTYEITVPMKNPNIYTTNMPSNFVFIVVGAIIAFVFASFLVYRIITSVIFNRKAKSEKEVYYSNQFMFSDSASSNFGSNLNTSYNGTSSNSSFFEKSTPSETSDFSSSTPGHSYRETAQPNRGSMYISPVLEVMNRKSVSQLELPLCHHGMGSTVSLLEKGSPLTANNDMLLDSNHKKSRRPPSLYLEDLLNDV